MSTRTYLDQKKLGQAGQNLQTFSTWLNENGLNNAGKSDGTGHWIESGPHILTAEILPKFAHLVGKIVFRDGESSEQNRKEGRYTLRTAWAKIEVSMLNVSHPKFGYWLNIHLECVNLKDGQDLYNLIRRGDIAPSDDWTGIQMPPMRKIADLFREALWIIFKTKLQPGIKTSGPRSNGLTSLFAMFDKHERIIRRENRKIRRREQSRQ